MVTKHCGGCNRSKNINCFNRTEWSKVGDYRRCGMCLKKPRKPNAKAGTEVWRRTMPGVLAHV